ncbi:MAG: hypothetical protein RJA99_1181 [Pseudomonadota bacterium]|jgi:hypothetical protein
MKTPLRFLLAAAFAATLAGCGHGHHDPGPVAPPVAGLGLQLTRTGPEVIQLDWSFDPAAAWYDVTRDGYPLARVSGTTTLIDASVYAGYRYCYRVTGAAPSGAVVSVSSTGCVTVF